MRPNIAAHARLRAASAANILPSSTRITRSVLPSSVSKAVNSRGGKSRGGAEKKRTALGEGSAHGLGSTNAAHKDELARSGWGYARAAREDAMGADMAKIAVQKGLVTEDIAKNWATPWRTTGTLTMNWNINIIEKFNEENGVVSQQIMDLKQAEAIKKKKDAAQEKWLEDYFAGKIDENGMRVSTSPVRRLPYAVDPVPAPNTINKPATKTTSQPVKSKTDRPAPLTPLHGRPDYAQYTYYQCAALCRERNIVSGGGVEALRNTLIQDDINVLRGLPRNAAKDSSASRSFKNKAPVVPNAPVTDPAITLPRVRPLSGVTRRRRTWKITRATPSSRAKGLRRSGGVVLGGDDQTPVKLRLRYSVDEES